MLLSFHNLTAFSLRLALVAALVAATACAPAVRQPEQPPLTGDIPEQFPARLYQPQSQPAAGKVLKINTALSDVRILVYRGGELARLGHNHVVSSGDLQGFVLHADDMLASRFDLFLPLDRLIVDDPALRAQQGDDFSSTVSASDSQGTRANMLGDKVLDAAQFPFLQIGGKVAESSPSTLTLNIDIDLHGERRSLQTLANVTEEPDSLIIEGSFEVRQSDFGIEPFSALLGRLRVLDEVKIKYRIVASSAGSEET